MTFVLVTVDGGIIDKVTFFTDKKKALSELKKYVKTMDEERNDAGVYDENDLVANAKMYMDYKKNIRTIKKMLKGAS